MAFSRGAERLPGFFFLWGRTAKNRWGHDFPRTTSAGPKEPLLTDWGESRSHYGSAAAAYLYAEE